MKKLSSINILFVAIIFVFTACQKSSIKPVEQSSILSSAENRTAIAKAIESHFAGRRMLTSGTSNGAQFVVPFFVGESQGVVSFNPAAGTLIFANFSAELSKGDFYRKNPDGTYSVHVNSNTALGEYSVIDLSDFSTSEYLYGMNGHLDADYTGELQEFPIYDEDGNLLFVFMLIDTSQSGRALFVHGNGKVGVDGASPWKSLSITAVLTPGGQANVDFSLK